MDSQQEQQALGARAGRDQRPVAGSQTSLRTRDAPAAPCSPAREWAGDPRWLLVERILATPDFLRSPRLADFLRYICCATLEGRSGQLSEQHIGEIVFGRSRDYDSSADTIVRSHALRLRRRLEQYGLRAGKQDALRLEIPRGGYVPLFVPAEPAAINASPQEPGGPEQASADEVSAGRSGPASLDGPPKEAEPAALPHMATGRSSETPARLGTPYRLAFALTLVLALLFASALALALYKRAVSRPSEAHHKLWSRLFTRDQPTRIVLGDSGLVLFHAVTWQYVSLHDYLSEDYSHQMESVQHVEPQFAAFLRGRRYTSMVDAATLDHLLRLPEATPDRTLVQYARDLRLNDFKSGNLILMGAEEADPWVELFEKSMDFVFTSNTPDHHAAFLNRRPAQGERAVYLSSAWGGAGKLYAVVAFLPNLSATGNVLLLEGSNMAGTESAVDLTMDDQRLLPLLDSLRQADGSLPHFELLLESDTIKDSAGPARVIAIHTHPF